MSMYSKICQKVISSFLTLKKGELPKYLIDGQGLQNNFSNYIGRSSSTGVYSKTWTKQGIDSFFIVVINTLGY